MKNFAAAVAAMFPGLSSIKHAHGSRGPMPKAPSKYGKLVHSGSTYNVGRNKHKREIKAWRAKGRAIQVRMSMGKKCPKGRELSFLRFAQ